MRTSGGQAPGEREFHVSEDEMSEHYLDEALFEELREILDTEFPTLINTFIQDSGLRLRELVEAFQRGQLDGVRKAAHSLKGASANLGLLRLAEECRLLEEAARDGCLGSDPATVAAVTREQARAVEILQGRL